jgi:hypothetical protein
MTCLRWPRESYLVTSVPAPGLSVVISFVEPKFMPLYFYLFFFFAFPLRSTTQLIQRTRNVLGGLYIITTPSGCCRVLFRDRNTRRIDLITRFRMIITRPREYTMLRLVLSAISIHRKSRPKFFIHTRFTAYGCTGKGEYVKKCAISVGI